MTFRLNFFKPISNEKASEVYYTNAPEDELNAAINTVKSDSSLSAAKPALLKSLLEMKGFCFEVYQADMQVFL